MCQNDVPFHIDRWHPFLADWLLQVNRTAPVGALTPSGAWHHREAVTHGMRTSEPTRHTCCAPGRGPGFIRTAGCPRCDELTAGAPARQQPWRRRETRAQEDARRAAEIRAHFNSERHRSGGCGPCCTFGEW